MFSLIYKNSVKKDVEPINTDDLQRISNSIQALKLDPLPVGVEKIKIGKESYYRIRQGDFRIGYRIDLAKKILEVIFIRRRNERTY